MVQDENVGKAVDEAVGLLGGIEAFVHPHDRVVVKPNLSTALPSNTGLTTDPRVVQAIIKLCRGVGRLEVTIAEGSGGADTKMAFERCGYTHVAERYDVKLVDLNEAETTMVDVPGGKAFRILGVPNIILRSDVLINVPKLKVSKGWATLSVKNLLGAVPGKGRFSGEMWTPNGKFFGARGEKKRVHANLDEGLVDLNMVIRPSLTVMDAVIASYENKPLKMHSILASRDRLALDSVAAKIIGLNLFDVPYLKRAAERGLGEADHDRIKVLGTPLEKLTTTWKAAIGGLQNPSTGYQEKAR